MCFCFLSFCFFFPLLIFFLTKRFSIIHCCGVSLNKSIFLCGSFFLLWFFCFPFLLAFSLPRCFPRVFFWFLSFFLCCLFLLFRDFETKIYDTNVSNVSLTSSFLKKKKKTSNHPEYWPLCFSISLKRKLKFRINLGVIIQYYLQ